jgi:hypothetical protein
VRVDDTTVTGIIRGSDGFHALLQARDKRTFIARNGEKLLDAVVKTVTPDAIVFSRTRDERLRANYQQDVVKKLRPAEGGRR